MFQKITSFIKTNKKIVFSFLSIAIVASLAIGGTIAYFSDTETSAGNTFKAGKLNLKIDSTCHYNGRDCVNGKWGNTDEACACNWEEKDLNGELFFNLNDVKPGDTGEDTISMHVINNDAWMCAQITNLKNYDNGCDSPESPSDTNCGTPGLGEGELQNYLKLTLWKDNGAGDYACNNELDPGEQTFVNNQPISDTLWPLADASTGGVPFVGDDTYCIGAAWTVPIETGNIIQTDSVTADIKFTAVQSRNMSTFLCSSLNGEPTDSFCGNAVCDPDENSENCIADCPAPSCTPSNGGVEICDGIDNDCDGQTDEDNPGGGGACSTGLQGLCAVGTLQCQQGGIVCVQNVQSTSEVCNGLDDNCDGQVDNNTAEAGTACDGIDSDLCMEGTRSCVAGALVCSDNTGGNIEVCDGQDNDCDEQTDEGLGTVSCGIGSCARTIDACQAGALVSCIPGNPVVEVCDGQDNDCDGTTDDGVLINYYKDADGDGYGQPGGPLQACTQPTVGYSTNDDDCNDANASVYPGAPEVVNDGIDQNCNGSDLN
jgi:predicted ribosomally synthesized peptide with SipW-like signal peptide